MMKTLAAALVAVVAVAASAQDTSGPPVGQTAKEFPITAALNMRPTKYPFRSCRGRVVLFTAYQTWYDGCADAVPQMNALQDKYGPKGLTVLAFGEQEAKLVEPWIKEKGVRFPWVLIDTPTAEQFKRDWPSPGMPWSYLVDVRGKVVWQGNPRNMENPGVVKPGLMASLLAEATGAPLLPPTLAEQQKLIDDGLWAAAQKSLEAAAAGGALSKPDQTWAKETAAWVVRRHAAWMTDADALCKQGHWWDAWEMMNDFPRRFEGMEGADKAAAKAKEIRETKTPEAEKDFKWGDDIWGKQAESLRELIAKKNWTPVRLKFKRLVSETKNTRWAERLAEMGEAIPPK
jgi:hypothetical protein